MPEPNDLVQLLKQESTAGGGDDADADDFSPWEVLDENDDAPSAAGYYMQETNTPGRDKDVLFWRENGVICAKDKALGIRELLAADIVRGIAQDSTVRSGQVRLQRNLRLEDGVNLLIQDDGELYVL